jgi:hypothetical protein
VPFLALLEPNSGNVTGISSPDFIACGLPSPTSSDSDLFSIGVKFNLEKQA